MRPINRIHVGYWSALHNVLLPVAAGSRLHQDVAKRSGQGVARCCGGSLSSSSMISLHKIKSSRDLEVRTYVHRLAGRSLHTTPPGTDTLSHHNFKCGRVKTSRQWRYLRGSTADSREERSVSSFEALAFVKAMLSATLMKHGCSALLSTPVHTTDFQQMRLRSVLKYSSSTCSSCPQARKLTRGTFFSLQTPLQRGCFNHLPSVASMEYEQRLCIIQRCLCVPYHL